MRNLNAFHRAGLRVGGSREVPRLKPPVKTTGVKCEPQGDSALAAVMLEETKMRRRAAEEMGMDVAFVVDCTSSMGAWIEAVKHKVRDIHACLATDVPLAHLRFAFVGYRDFNDGADRFIIRDFTPSVDSFESVLSTVRAVAIGPKACTYRNAHLLT